MVLGFPLCFPTTVQCSSKLHNVFSSDIEVLYSVKLGLHNRTWTKNLKTPYSSEKFLFWMWPCIVEHCMHESVSCVVHANRISIRVYECKGPPTSFAIWHYNIFWHLALHLVFFHTKEWGNCTYYQQHVTHKHTCLVVRAYFKGNIEVLQMQVTFPGFSHLPFTRPPTLAHAIVCGPTIQR